MIRSSRFRFWPGRRGRPDPRRRGQEGSSLVEFALVAPLMVLLLIAIMAIGVIINAKIVVSDAAREAGRTWSIVQDDSLARAKAADALMGGGLKFADGHVVLFDANRDVRFYRQGDYIRAVVLYRQPTFAPLLAELIDRANSADGYLQLKSEAIFRVER